MTVVGVHVRHRLVQGKEYCQGDHNRAWELTDWSRIGVLLLCSCYCYCVPHVRCSRRRIYKRERKDNNFRMPHTAAIEEGYYPEQIDNATARISVYAKQFAR